MYILLKIQVITPYIYSSAYLEALIRTMFFTSSTPLRVPPIVNTISDLTKAPHRPLGFAILSLRESVIGLGLGPLLFGPLGEVYGRKESPTQDFLLICFHAVRYVSPESPSPAGANYPKNSICYVPPFIGPIFGPLVSG